MGGKPTTVAEYMAGAPEAAQPHLRQLHAILAEVAPEAKQVLKWGSPVFEQKRILFSYSAFKEHVTFMPTHGSLEPFAVELESVPHGKDTIQVRYDQPLPADLIRRIAEHRFRDVMENDARWMGR